MFCAYLVDVSYQQYSPGTRPTKKSRRGVLLAPTTQHVSAFSLSPTPYLEIERTDSPLQVNVHQRKHESLRSKQPSKEMGLYRIDSQYLGRGIRSNASPTKKGSPTHADARHHT